MIRRMLLRAIAIGLPALAQAGGAFAARKPDDDVNESISILSATWSAKTGTATARVNWFDEEWSAPAINTATLTIVARTGEEWFRLRSVKVKRRSGYPVETCTVTVPESKLSTARAADQLDIVATRRHGDDNGDFEIAWYASRTIAGKPLPAASTLPRTHEFPCNAIYADAVVEECRFDGVDLAGVDLRNSDLNDTHLEAASFRGARLSKAFITRTHLTGADFRGADLRRAVLVQSHMVGANLSEANLAGADLTGVRLDHARLIGARLANAFVGDAHLEGANLAGAILTGTDFSFSNMTRATLAGATIDSATSFFGVTFCGTTMPDGSINNDNC